MVLAIVLCLLWFLCQAGSFFVKYVVRRPLWQFVDVVDGASMAACSLYGLWPLRLVCCCCFRQSWAYLYLM